MGALLTDRSGVPLCSEVHSAFETPGPWASQSSLYLDGVQSYTEHVDLEEFYEFWASNLVIWEIHTSVYSDIQGR